MDFMSFEQPSLFLLSVCWVYLFFYKREGFFKIWKFKASFYYNKSIKIIRRLEKLFFYSDESSMTLLSSSSFTLRIKF